MKGENRRKIRGKMVRENTSRGGLSTHTRRRTRLRSFSLSTDVPLGLFLFHPVSAWSTPPQRSLRSALTASSRRCPTLACRLARQEREAKCENFLLHDPGPFLFPERAVSRAPVAPPRRGGRVQVLRTTYMRAITSAALLPARDGLSLTVSVFDAVGWLRGKGDEAW